MHVIPSTAMIHDEECCGEIKSLFSVCKDASKPISSIASRISSGFIRERLYLTKADFVSRETYKKDINIKQ